MSEAVLMRSAWRNIALVLLPILAIVSESHGDDADDKPVAAAANNAAQSGQLVLVIRGAAGTDEYGQLFDSWCLQWSEAASRGGATVVRIGPEGTEGQSSASRNDGTLDSDRSLLETTLQKAAAQAKSKQTSELWIVLIGHGTFDGRSARFNLRGQDMSADDLKMWLAPVSCPIAIANCSSASGPFLSALAGPDRVVMTATKSGVENNFSRFGKYLSEAVGDPQFDLDKDGQTSLFEAYLSASRRTLAFYETEGRLATEHALLDDNGDGMGIRADFYRGIRLTKKTKSGATADGRIAHRFHLVRSDSEQQLSPETRRQRDLLETAVIRLRDQKDSFENTEDYYAQLEELLVQLAGAYELAGANADEPEPSSAR